MERSIDYLKAKLSMWKGEFLSIGGRITLLNSTLNNIPLYMISFFKAPKVVLKTIVSFQARFLCHGVNDKKGISWISLSIVCKSKKEGELGVKDISLVNMTLLANWKWVFLHEREAIWKDLLDFRHDKMEKEVFNKISPKSLRMTFI